MATLEAGLTRDEAFALLQEHNKDPFHIEHGETVEQTMRYFAREFDPENEEFWGIVGLLHDLDWEEHDDEPELHTIYAAPLIEAAGGSPSSSAHPEPHLRLQPGAAEARAADGEDPVRLRRTDRSHRRGGSDAPLEERHGFRSEVAEEEVQGQEICRRLLPGRDRPGGPSCWAGTWTTCWR